MATAKERREQRAAEQAKRKEQVGEAQVQAEQERSAQVEKTNQAHMANPGAVINTQGEKPEPKRSGRKVIVACKLGVAYHSIRLSRLEEKWENTQSGPRLIKEAIWVGPAVVLRGTAYPRGTVPDGFPEKPVIVNGAALNFDIDGDWWDRWFEANKLNPVVVNKLIFAHEQLDHVKGMATDLKNVTSGIDPINPKSDPRITRSTRTDLTNIETEESRAKKMERLNS